MSVTKCFVCPFCNCISMNKNDNYEYQGQSKCNNCSTVEKNYASVKFVGDKPDFLSQNIFLPNEQNEKDFTGIIADDCLRSKTSAEGPSIRFKTSKDDLESFVNKNCADGCVARKTNRYQRMYFCKICRLKFLFKTGMCKHEDAVIKDGKNYLCDQCFFYTKYVQNFRYHLFTHAGKKPFKCDKCEYSCMKKRYLSIHMKIHSDVRPFKCDHCNFTTKYSSCLAAHKRLTMQFCNSEKQDCFQFAKRDVFNMRVKKQTKTLILQHQ